MGEKWAALFTAVFLSPVARETKLADWGRVLDERFCSRNTLEETVGELKKGETKHPIIMEKKLQ
ncbi:hypothetical protein QUA03_12475 [Microcoleus sp. S36b_A4]|uniref:hypothetical protein n=1 Tax=Microcoleus sp. S36b_A4 TaxID=3055420 RepID=UPI002FCEB422